VDYRLFSCGELAGRDALITPQLPRPFESKKKSPFRPVPFRFGRPGGVERET